MARRGKGLRSGVAAGDADQQHQQHQQQQVGGGDAADGGYRAEHSPPGSPTSNDCSHHDSSSSRQAYDAPVGPQGSHSSTRGGERQQQKQQPQQQDEEQLQQAQQPIGSQAGPPGGSYFGGSAVPLQQQQQQQQQDECAVAILIPPSPLVAPAEAAAFQAAAAALQAAAAAGDVEALRRQQVVDAAAARARKKLVMASGVCLVFMAIEIVAGVAANSLALMTDASHLLSDLCAFLISLFALWVSQLRGTLSMSFGYHRAEILGALLSVLLIWGVTAALVVAALDRIASPVQVQGGLMFLTATIGTAANVFMAKILHIHSHGIGRVHTEQHQHAPAAAASSCSSSTVSPQQLTPKHAQAPSCCGSSSNSSSSSSSSSNAAHIHPKKDCGSSHKGPETELLLLQQEGEEGLADQQLQQQQQAAAAAPAAAGGAADVYVKLEGDPETEIESMNLRAAYIHALGDLLQNIGVMIASAIIWFKPEYSVADPICTLLFSVFVLLTTLSIIREAVNVLMEGTPLGLDVAELQADLVSLRGVLEVHDLHVWSISVGRPALACHLVVCDEEAARRVLKAATTLCQRKHRILHTTIQCRVERQPSVCLELILVASCIKRADGTPEADPDTHEIHRHRNTHT
ncbi:hypothetical protein Efla_002483 [Eimeria flavescens]